jgi:hypothetical protein
VEVEFGCNPLAYLQGVPGGSEVVWELVTPNRTQPLLRRFFDPVGNVSDRGAQSQKLILPPLENEVRLVLRTIAPAGEANEANWLYLARVEMHRHPNLLPEQFPGFSRVPDAAETPNYLPAAETAEKQLLIHAPAKLTFRLGHGERRLQFDYGLLEGAYTGSGQTDGATFRVILISPGASDRQLFERYLNPLQAPADRGTQRLDLTLPPSDARAQLVINIDLGPAGNGAWDWALLGHLRLQ